MANQHWQKNKNNFNIIILFFHLVLSYINKRIKLQSNNVPHLNLHILVQLYKLEKILCDGEDNETFNAVDTIS